MDYLWLIFNSLSLIRDEKCYILMAFKSMGAGGLWEPASSLKFGCSILPWILGGDFKSDYGYLDFPGDFPGGSVVKNPPANARDLSVVGSIPGSRRSPGGGHGNPLRYSWLENPMDRGAWMRSPACMSLGYSSCSHKESDMTKVRAHTHTHTHGNLQPKESGSRRDRTLNVDQVGWEWVSFWKSVLSNPTIWYVHFH